MPLRCIHDIVYIANGRSAREGLMLENYREISNAPVMQFGFGKFAGLG